MDWFTNLLTRYYKHRKNEGKACKLRVGCLGDSNIYEKICHATCRILITKASRKSKNPHSSSNPGLL